MKLTSRDKKLLVFLAIFLIIVGGGAGVIVPLLNKSQELTEELTEAKLEQIEKEQKVTSLAGIKKKKEEAEASLDTAKQEFYEITPSMGIDKMLTEMALSKGVVVTELDISMPAAGEYTALTDYETMLRQHAANAGSNGEQTDEPEELVYGGMYTAKAELTMSGSREALQAVLDNCAALEPKMRVSEFLWQDTLKEQEGAYTLSIALDIYMTEDTQQYLLEQAARSAVSDEENNTDNNSDTETEE